MKKITLFLLLVFGSFAAFSQSPIIDYTFLAVPPSVIVKSVVEQPDGKILLGGSFMNYAGSGKNHLVRLNHDGTVDPTFNTVGTGPNNAVEDIALMADGRIVIGGNFTSYNGTLCYFVCRLFANGSIDGSFNIPPSVINGAVLAIDIHTSDKVLAAGEFSVCYGHTMPHIARFNYDGSLDTTFNIGTGFNEDVYDILVLPDARIVASGKFVWFNGNVAGNIALLTAGGPYDASMDTDPGFSGFASIGYDLERQADGKILVGGSFSYHNATMITGLARLNMDGTRDMSFTPPFYPYAIVRALAVQADNRILVGGEFTSAMYNPGITGPNRIARLYATGLIDTTFDVGPGIPSSSAFVEDITIQADQMTLIGGLFDMFDTETMYKQIIRLNEEATPQGINELTASSEFFIWPNPTEGIINFENPFEGQSDVMLEIFSLTGQALFKKEIEFTGELYQLGIDLPSGVYFIRMASGNELRNARLLVK